MRLDHFTHVVVLVFQRQRNDSFTVFLSQQLHGTLQVSLFRLELFARVVADNVFRSSLLDRPVNADQMIETVIFFGMFGTLGGRQQRVDLANHLKRIDHLVLGVSGMDVAPLHGDLRARGIEIFILQLPFETAVHRIGELRAESLHIKEIDAPPYLFVGRETDPQFAVRNFGMGHQVFDSRHNLGHPRLIIGSQQRRTIRGNQRMSLEKGQFRKIRHTHRQRIV